jgi:hypothetical protein
MNPAKTDIGSSLGMLACALALLLNPGSMLASTGIAPSAVAMARIFGRVLLLLGFYHLMVGRFGGLVGFHRWSNRTRLSASIFGSLFVFTGVVSPLLLLVFGVDLADPLWTASGLPADQPERGPWHDITNLLTVGRS